MTTERQGLSITLALGCSPEWRRLLINITAKVLLSHSQKHGTGDNQYSIVTFTPDYQDGRNKEWAAATPHLELRMTLRNDVAAKFELGKSYTLTFTEETAN